jgi:3-deoxy-D-manno-octulosonic-acid transferase
MNFIIYHIFYKTLRILLSCFSFLLPEKIQTIINDRKTLKLTWREQPNDKPLWFHCASGEIEYIKPLLRKIKQEHPEKKLFISYYSPSAKPMVDRAVFQTLEADGYAPLPWDEPSFIDPFLKELNPQALIISRTDLWPQLIRKCHLNKIPMALVAATFAPGSKKMSFLGKLSLSLSLPLLNKICVVSEDDKKMAQEFFPKLQFIVTGDPRFDQVIYRIQYQQKELPQKLIEWAKEPIWIAGSTWPEDEAVIIPALKKLNTFVLENSTHKASPSANVKLILVPHETDTEHLQNLSEKLNAATINFEFYSKITAQEINNNTQVLIFDQKGYLLDLYRLASLALIGGSFKQQVHSVMEALGQGCFVLVGPHHLNNREAIEFQALNVNSRPLVNCINNSDELAKNLIQHLLEIDSLPNLQAQQNLQMQDSNLKTLVQEKFKLKTRATEITYKEIQEYLDIDETS